MAHDSSQYTTKIKQNQYSFERKSSESGTAFLFYPKQKKWTIDKKQKQASFEKKSSESGTAFLFYS